MRKRAQKKKKRVKITDDQKKAVMTRFLSYTRRVLELLDQDPKGKVLEEFLEKLREKKP